MADGAWSASEDRLAVLDAVFAPNDVRLARPGYIPVRAAYPDATVRGPPHRRGIAPPRGILPRRVLKRTNQQGTLVPQISGAGSLFSRPRCRHQNSARCRRHKIGLGKGDKDFAGSCQVPIAQDFHELQKEPRKGARSTGRLAWRLTRTMQNMVRRSECGLPSEASRRKFGKVREKTPR